MYSRSDMPFLTSVPLIILSSVHHLQVSCKIGNIRCLHNIDHGYSTSVGLLLCWERMPAYVLMAYTHRVQP